MNDTKVYCGPLGHLLDKTALIRPGYAPDQVLAQFDDHTATRSGKPFAEVTHTTALVYDPPADCLGYGWHLFPVDHFRERE